MLSSDFDHNHFVNCVTQWIDRNDELFLPCIDKQRRFNRSRKINYWQTPWGEMLLNPEVSDTHSRI